MPTRSSTGGQGADPDIRNGQREGESLPPFPAGFIWGAATSAYQIEGAAAEDGRGPSIWDTFCRQPGRIYQGQNGDVAADHYHRWAEDVDLMARLGLGAYRFSVSWPRVQPEGRGAPNAAGLDFYDRLVDALLARGIQPFVTLYHFDLPQALQDRGGWPARDTALRFADYAGVVARRLGDRAVWWITHNEPAVTAALGHYTGEHAPGVRSPLAFARAVHHLLFSHGLAAAAVRAEARAVPRVGIALNLSPVYPAAPADGAAAVRYDLAHNRLFLDPLLRGAYPEGLLGRLVPALARARSGDLDAIAAPLDFLGVNYYTRTIVRRSWRLPVAWAGEAPPPNGSPMSEMWEVYPQGLGDLLGRLRRDYRPGSIVVTENGAPFPDVVEADGSIQDTRRVAYLRDHVGQVAQAVDQGVPVKGYFVWSLLDNFEWTLGYRMRFGLIHVDYASQRRTVKESGWLYRDLILERPPAAEERAGGAK